MLVLGLDVSTSVIGVCVYDSSLEKHLLLDHIEFKNEKNVWEKADTVLSYLSDGKFNEHKIELLAIEQIAKMFSMGMSSADTITSLARFNGIVSYLARAQFLLDPVHILPAQLRKACGLRLVHKKKDPTGRSHKEQVFDLITSTDLKMNLWPLKKRSKKLVGWAYDEVDAYVVAKGSARLHPKGV